MCIASLLFLFISVLHAATLTYATPNRLCEGVLSTSEPVRKNVDVPVGASCRIRDTAISGNILVRDNATLVTEGKVWISGTIKSFPNTTVHVFGRSRVLGMINIEDGRLATGQESYARTITARTNSHIVHKGQAGTIETTGSTSVLVMGGRVTSRGIHLGGGVCNMTLFNASISGGVSLSNCTTANIEQEKRIIFTAHRSRISGLVKLDGGVGEMFVASSRLYGGIIANATGGTLDIRGSLSGTIDADRIGNLFVQDSIIRGAVRTNLIADDVHVNNSRFIAPSDITLLETDNNVILSGNDFAGSLVTVKRARLSMLVQKNRQFSARIVENGMQFGGMHTAKLVFTHNVVNKAVFVNNFPTLNIKLNAFEALSCVGNAQVSGGGNSIAINGTSCFT